MADLVVVSNRGPVSFRLDEAGRPVRAGSGGGLASALHPLLRGTGATWVAAAMGAADRQAVAEGLMVEDGLRLVPVLADPDDYRMAYDVVSNATLWFCHHHLADLPRRPRFDRHWREAWEAYRRVNRHFARAVAEEAPEGAVVLVQDYHLALTGSPLAEARPDLRTVHFSHTPFGDPSALRTLPTYAAGELLAAMAHFGACGFHSARWEAAFRACYDDPALAEAAGGAAAPPSFTSPLGTDPEAVRAEAAGPAAVAAGPRLARAVGDHRLIVRVDRVELSKNILRGIWAMDELLAIRPRWRGQVVLLALAYASREGLADYLAYRAEIEHAAEVVNARWAEGDWRPVLLEVADDRPRSVAALTRYDVLLVNPVRDGLNLVAVEGPIVNERDGVLVLSREAGIQDQLADVAFTVNPFDLTDTAEALDAALSLGPAARAERSAELRRRALARTAADWLAEQLAAAPA